MSHVKNGRYLSLSEPTLCSNSLNFQDHLTRMNLLVGGVPMLGHQPRDAMFEITLIKIGFCLAHFDRDFRGFVAPPLTYRQQ